MRGFPQTHGLNALLLLLLVCASAWAYDSRCPQGLPFTVRPYNDHCYQFVTEEKYWDDAREYCSWYGGKLVKIGDRQTSTFIKNTINGLRWYKNGVWIGLHDSRKEMTWHWVTQTPGLHEPMTYSDWGRGHPGGFWHSIRDCVRMVRKDGWRWHEAPCHFMGYKYRFICEYDALPTTTTTTTTTEATTIYVPPVVQRHYAGEQNQLPVEKANMKLAETTENKPDDDLTTTHTNEIHVFVGAALNPLARKQLDKEKENPAVLPAVLACSIFGLVMLIVVLLLFIRRRRKAKNNSSVMPRFDNVVYQPGETEQCGCADSTASGLLVNECSVEVTGLKSKRVENEYFVQEFDSKTVDTKLTGRSTSGHSESESEAEDCDPCLMKRPLPEEPYEIPKTTATYYLSMNGPKDKDNASPVMARQRSSEAGYMRHDPPQAGGEECEIPGDVYETPQPGNVYSEIPCLEGEYGNIYETLDDVKDKKERYYANS